MKKKLLFLFSVCLYFHISYAQDQFTVIKVSGNIVIERTGSSLDIGTSFPQDENLVFKIPESRAAVINPQRGRYLLTSENESEFKTSKSNFLPSSGKVSTRAFGMEPLVSNLSDQLQGNCVILNELKMNIDTMKYPMSEKSFFYISYDYEGKTVNKKLDFTKDTLLIKKKELLIVDGAEIPDPDIKQMRLIFYEQGQEYKSTTVSSFAPVIPNFFTITEEIRLMLGLMADKTYNEKINEISSFVQEFYGNIDDNNLKMWLKRYFDLSQ